MSDKKNLLAFDFGASGGRAIVATYDGDKIELDEVHRFANEPVTTEQYFYWDTLRLFHELKEGIRRAVRKYGRIDSIGIDTWGVDYGLLYEDGSLLTNPIHYRDSRTDEAINEVQRLIPYEDMYRATGLAHQTFNSIYQLYSEKMIRPDLFSLTDKVLYTPDLLAYLLTGNKFNEYTIASTGGLVNAFSKEYDQDIMGRLGFNSDIFPDIIMPGNLIGETSDFINEDLGIDPISVIAVCTHDTASAVTAIPLDKDVHSAYLISGTWSLLGIESDEPICSDVARDEGFTNEGGGFDKYVFLKNITGLWLMQSLRREWGNKYEKLSYDDIENLARDCKAKGLDFSIDPNDPRFSNPISMIDEIAGFCEEQGQGRPQTVGELGLAIYNGLAREYRNSVLGLERVTGEKIAQLNMVGGGIQDKFLSELTCAALGIPVLAGPIEASVAGNILMQLKGLGVIDDVEEGRQIIRRSFEIKDFS